MELDRRNLPPSVVERISGSLGAEFLTARHSGFDISYQNKVLEHRVHRGVELRTGDGEAPIIAGYATVYDQPYDVLGGPPMGWAETIRSGAAAKSILEQDHVYLFFDHEGLPLASTKDGSLILKSDKLGLYNESRVDPRSNWSMEIANRVASGLLDSMSFAFQATRQEWNTDYTERFINEVRLFDVSVVSFPANPVTSVMTHSAIRSAMGELRAGRTLSAANIAVLSAVLADLASADIALEPLRSIIDETDEALDSAQQALSDVLGVANPDTDDAAEISEDVGEAKGMFPLGLARRQADALRLVYR